MLLLTMVLVKNKTPHAEWLLERQILAGVNPPCSLLGG